MQQEVITVNQVERHEGQSVRLRGHIHTVRRMGALTFIVLRDRTGLLQVIADQGVELPELGFEQATIVTGVIVKNPADAQKFEMRLTGIELLSSKNTIPPVEISKPKKMETLGMNTLLNYRPLTLRNEKIRAIFKIEAAICAAFREYLTKEAFTEIHSSKIVSTGTEGGANLFAVDYFGTKAYLAQSPQFYKQIMVGVFERVFEVGPVYRAEEHNTVRHLNEYISLDLEMGFIENEQDLLKLETKLLQFIFGYIEQSCEAELALHHVKVPEISSIPSVSLAEAHEIVRKYSEKCNSRSTSKSRPDFAKNATAALTQEKEDLDPEAERLLCEYFMQEHGSELVFVTHYPWSVRPFYAMPEAGTHRSHSFDLLFRGLEITTGGQRIHQYEQLLECMTARGLNPESFEDYLQCFRYGMPPHGGLAIGLERLVKQLLALSNVREASLFPRDCNRLTP